MFQNGWTILAALVPLLALSTAGHALLYKRDPRAALGWIAVCILFPVAGPILYYFFGINRISTRAKELTKNTPLNLPVEERPESDPDYLSIPDHYRDIFTISNEVTKRPLVGGNHLDMLLNGDEAYPAMLESIATAKKTCFLTSYIFSTDNTGHKFIDALAAATTRGVDVRVILDGVGEWYSLPRAGSLLKKKKIRFTRFLPPRLFPPSFYINLRNHRKILVVDEQVGYTGGMNISDHRLTEDRKSVADIHFRIKGPVVSQMNQVFLEDWGFCTGEHPGAEKHPKSDSTEVLCRAIVDGPNEDLDKLVTILIGAIHTAKKSIRIINPYFLPTREIISVLQIAALRGIDIAIILPAVNNLPFVHWASRNMLWELLTHNIKIYYQPPPFSHTKLFITDDQYVHIGSANLDPRSLRLNFEFNIEICSKAFGRKLSLFFEEIRQKSTLITLEEMDSRSFLLRIRDALFWVFTPYL